MTSTTDVTKLYLVDVTVPSAWTIAQQATCYVRDVCDQAVNLRGLVSGRTYMLAVQGVNGVGAGRSTYSGRGMESGTARRGEMVAGAIGVTAASVVSLPWPKIRGSTGSA